MFSCGEQPVTKTSCSFCSSRQGWPIESHRHHPLVSWTVVMYARYRHVICGIASKSRVSGNCRAKRRTLRARHPRSDGRSDDCASRPTPPPRIFTPMMLTATGAKLPATSQVHGLAACAQIQQRRARMRTPLITRPGRPACSRSSRVPRVRGGDTAGLRRHRRRPRPAGRLAR